MIYPFAPDQSGAAAVLYEMGGMIIIVDAGGCAGNICGFDEPRWLDTKSAIFSAGLRDMDAIMGRDDLMIDKITRASKKIDARFVALIGTPVPATIGTDYKALRRMAEKRTGLPVITMNTSGAGWYDEGIEKSYEALIGKFTNDAYTQPVMRGTAGVLGVTPLDSGRLDAADRIGEILKAEGMTEVFCHGTACGLSDLGRAGSAEKNIVAAVSGLKAARMLKEKYGTPYECIDPLARDALEEALEGAGADTLSLFGGKRVLIIHQQVRANTIRNIIREELKKAGMTEGGSEASRTGAGRIDAATWFMLDDEIKEEGDFRIKEESDFFNTIENGGYDVIMADPSFRKAAKGFSGTFIDLPHFAVSGVLR
jgi:nitrogenase molybdenum-iron protein alpha/beta subunit